MSRYIEADKVLKELRLNHKDVIYIDKNECAKRIEKIPSIDIVRCKDCVHCADDWNGNQPMFTCELGRCGESVQPDDFCSYGKTEREGE